MNKKQIRKMQTAAGGPIYEKDWSDRWEPYATKMGLAGDVIGLGAATTGIGVPVGAAIAGFTNVPNLIIDGYQTARDTWRSFNDGGNSLGSAVWNGGEFLLDAVGLKALQYINKAAKAGVASKKYLTSTEKALDSKPWKRVGTGHGRVKARQSANYKREYNSRRNKALEESNVELAKRGVRPAQGLYYQQKLTDEMAKRSYGVAVNDAIKSANRTLRQNLGIINGISGGTNLYHILKKEKGGMLQLLKKGSGIHIKEKNKGKFTSYCGGKVTDECIRKAKASGNPTLVKRATFAANARKWKHKDGGVIKANLGQKLGNFLNSDLGKFSSNGVLNLFQTGVQNSQLTGQANIFKAQNEMEWNQMMEQLIKRNQIDKNNQYLQWMSDYQSGRTLDQPSQLVAQHLGYKQLSQDLAKGKQNLKNQNAIIDNYVRSEQASNWGSAIGGILQEGLGLAGNYLSSKGTTTPVTTGSSVYKVDSFWTNPTLKASTPTYSFNIPTLTPPKTNYIF